MRTIVDTNNNTDNVHIFGSMGKKILKVSKDKRRKYRR
jgi:hypothetical protein